MRRFFVAANWKMNGEREAVARLLSGINELMQIPRCDIILAPAFVHIDQVLKTIKSPNVFVAGQNCSEYPDGAFTGEVSAHMLLDVGCDWVILGHSERRANYGETNEVVAAKIKAAVAVGLGVILCVGETLNQRDTGEAKSAVSEQLLTALDGSVDNDTKLLIAYEPVWAIGTGLTASPEQAQSMHAFIRENLKRIDCINADDTPILYGGSVNSKNASNLFDQQDVDGALVGGASLDAREFCAIAQVASEKGDRI